MEFFKDHISLEDLGLDDPTISSTPHSEEEWWEKGSVKGAMVHTSMTERFSSVAPVKDKRVWFWRCEKALKRLSLEVRRVEVEEKTCQHEPEAIGEDDEHHENRAFPNDDLSP